MGREHLRREGSISRGTVLDAEAANGYLTRHGGQQRPCNFQCPADRSKNTLGTLLLGSDEALAMKCPGRLHMRSNHFAGTQYYRAEDTWEMAGCLYLRNAKLRL